MNKRRKAVILTAAVVFIILLVFVIILRVKSPIEGEVTRYEWIKMLCGQTGMTEYESSEPYFRDVDGDDEYFPYIQSAVEWGIVEAGADFSGDAPVSGREIALTAMKTIGSEKIQIFLENNGEITEDTYIALAIENGLIEEEQLTKGFTEEECEQVLETLSGLYFGVFWKDDYASVTYQNGVVELSLEDVLLQAPDSSAILVTEKARESLEVGSILVFEQSNTGLKIAREVTGIDTDGTVFLIPAELDRVVESLVVSDITELTLADIVRYYGLSEDVSAVSYLNPWQTASTGIHPVYFPIELSSRGFALSVSTVGEGEERHLEIQATDRGTGVSYTFPVSYPVEPDEEYQAEIEIDKIAVGGQITYSALEGGVQYADVAVDSHATFTSGIQAEVEKKIRLFQTPVPLGGGLVGVDIQIFLVLSVDGSISFEAELPLEVSVAYEKGHGLKNFNHDISVEDPRVEVDCNVGVKLRLEPTLVVLGCLDVVDVEADIGVSAGANVVTHLYQTCADISVSFPVITISVCGDDDADTFIGNLGLAAEWEVLSSDDAPVQFGLHYELLSNGSAGFVEECTYKEGEEGEGAEPEIEAETEDAGETVAGSVLNHTYYTRYGEVNQVDAIGFCFDYPDNWEITSEEVTVHNVNPNALMMERVTLSSSNGTTIIFDCRSRETIGQGGMHAMCKYEVTKVADASFVYDYPDNDWYLSNIIVAEITETEEMFLDTDEDYYPVNGVRMYALVPDSYIGTHEVAGLYGYMEEFSFKVDGYYLIYAEDVCPEDEQEVIDILASFREGYDL